MALPQPAPAVMAFFESYRTAFQRLDALAVTDHFAFPLHITSETGDAVIVAGRQDWLAQVERLVAMYRAIGFGSAQATRLEAAELSPRLFQSFVHWALYDTNGASLYDFAATYTLPRGDEALRITTSRRRRRARPDSPKATCSRSAVPGRAIASAPRVSSTARTAIPSCTRWEVSVGQRPCPLRIGRSSPPCSTRAASPSRSSSWGAPVCARWSRCSREFPWVRG